MDPDRVRQPMSSVSTGASLSTQIVTVQVCRKRGDSHLLEIFVGCRFNVTGFCNEDDNRFRSGVVQPSFDERLYQIEHSV